MVIQKFNSLIRNKWIWGVFAVTVATVFVLPDGCFRQSGEEKGASFEEKLSNLDNYDSRLEKKCEELLKLKILDYVQLPNLFQLPYNYNIPLSAFFKADEKAKLYAAVQTFKDAGVVITDEMLSEHIQSIFSLEDKPFNPDEYKDFIKRKHNISAVKFEEYLRLALTLRNGLLAQERQRVVISDIEQKSKSQTYSDKFTVSFAVFNEDAKEAAKVKVDDAAVSKWYADNKGSLKLPERYKVRYVKIPLSGVATTNLLAKAAPSEESVKARYEANRDKGIYKISTTNGVESVKPLKDVREAIVAELKGEEVKKMIVDNVYDFFEKRGKKDPALLDDFVSDNLLNTKLKIEDAWLAFKDFPKDEILDKYQDGGFITDTRFSFLGVDPSDLKNSVCFLENGANDIIKTSDFIFLINRASADEKIEKSHEPELDEIRTVVESLALDEARAQKFKATVEAVKEKGLDAVVKRSGASTNIVFQLVGLDSQKSVLGEYQNQIVPELLKLKKGEVSEFTLLEPGKAFLVACQDRIPGSAEDYEKAEEYSKNQAIWQRQNTMVQFISNWLDWNLKRLGYTK